MQLRGHPYLRLQAVDFAITSKTVAGTGTELCGNEQLFGNSNLA